MASLKKLFAPVDMTAGKPWKNIALFTIPMIIGNIAQQLYNTVDSIVVGKFVGDNALAAVGSASPIFNLLLVLFIGISVGTSVMVSQYFGARDREQLSRTIGCCVTLTAAASVFIMIVGSLVVRPLLELLHTPASIIDWCASYLTVLFYGIAGVAYYNILGGVLRGLGDSVSALVYLLVATVINIVLDVWFVAGLGLGVFGVALATAIAQAVSAILCFLKLARMSELFDMKPRYLKAHKDNALNIIRLGLPSGLTQAIFSLAMIMVQSLTNSFGEMLIAANVIIMRVDGFAMMPNFSFGTTMTTYAGQNVGAKQYDRVEQGAKAGDPHGHGRFGLHYGRPHIWKVFDGDLHFDHRVSRSELLYDADPGRWLYRHGGDPEPFRRHERSRRHMTPMWISLFTTVVIRVPVAYGISWLTRTPELPNGRSECVFISLLLSWTLGAVMTAVCYKRGRWKKKAIQ